MAETTEIAWTDATFNPWWGCQKVSPACTYCYAEPFANRMGYSKAWSGQYRVFGKDHFKAVLKWDKKAADKGKPLNVFTGSMCDILDDFQTIKNTLLKKSLEDSRKMLFDLMEETKNINWLALTKRENNIYRFMPSSWLANPPENIRLGVTAENQPCADQRISVLLEDWKGKNFVSMEPLLGAVDIARFLAPRWLIQSETSPSGKTLFKCTVCGRISQTPDKKCSSPKCEAHRRLDWVIGGAESGFSARPSHPLWFTYIQEACHVFGVKFFFKQWGEWIPLTQIGAFYNEKPHNPMLSGWSIRPEYRHLLDHSYRFGTLTYSGDFWESASTWNGNQLDADNNFEVTMYRFGKSALEKAGVSNLLGCKVYQEFPKC